MRDYRTGWPYWQDVGDSESEESEASIGLQTRTIRGWPPRNACGRTEEEERQYQGGHKIMVQQQRFL